MIRGDAAVDQRLDHVGGDVLGGRVDHLAEVAHRQLGHDAPVVVDVERAPAAVAALHRQQPVDAAPDRGVRRAAGPPAGRARSTSAVSSVSGYQTLSNSKDQPPGRPRRGISHQSPKRSTSLASSHCAERARAGSSGRQARVAQGHRGQRRVPDGGQAGLDPQAVAVLDPEGAVEARQAPRDHRVVQGVAQRVQRDDRVDPRRLDAAPGAVGLLAVADPARDPRLRPGPQATQRPPVVGARQRHGAAEPRRPGPGRLGARRRPAARAARGRARPVPRPGGRWGGARAPPSGPRRCRAPSRRSGRATAARAAAA